MGKGLPSTSASLQPNSCSAARFQSRVTQSGSITTMGSGEDLIRVVRVCSVFCSCCSACLRSVISREIDSNRSTCPLALTIGVTTTSHHFGVPFIVGQ